MPLATVDKFHCDDWACSDKFAIASYLFIDYPVCIAFSDIKTEIDVPAQQVIHFSSKN